MRFRCSVHNLTFRSPFFLLYFELFDQFISSKASLTIKGGISELRRLLSDLAWAPYEPARVETSLSLGFTGFNSHCVVMGLKSVSARGVKLNCTVTGSNLGACCFRLFLSHQPLGVGCGGPAGIGTLDEYPSNTSVCVQKLSLFEVPYSQLGLCSFRCRAGAAYNIFPEASRSTP
jgi:hypothetical protein